MNKDRIQIDGVWYVKESNVITAPKKIEIKDTDLIWTKGVVYETDKYCWEATKIYNENGVLYSGLDIKFLDKTSLMCDEEHWDNDRWMVGVLENDEGALKEARSFLEEDSVAHFQAFLAKLREHFWL